MQRAREENTELLPHGLETERMLDPSRTSTPTVNPSAGRGLLSTTPVALPDVAFLYDIEVIETRRGGGLGRALLAAVEDATRLAGAIGLELNVFGPQSHPPSLSIARPAMNLSRSRCARRSEGERPPRARLAWRRGTVQRRNCAPRRLPPVGVRRRFRGRPPSARAAARARVERAPPSATASSSRRTPPSTATTG